MLGTWSSQSACPLSSFYLDLTRTPSFRGPSATAFLEWLTPSSLKSLAPYSSTLSVLLNERGGIIDDTIITKHAEDAYYVVTNAGRRDRDLAWFKEKVAEWNAGEKAKADGPVEHEVLEGWGLLALQGASLAFVSGSSTHPRAGPEAAQYLQGLTSYDLRELTFGKCAFVPIEGFNLHVARGGYTGEDGFEVCPSPRSSPSSQNTNTSRRSRFLPRKPLRSPSSSQNRPCSLQASAPATVFASRLACVFTARTSTRTRRPSRLV